MNTIPELGFFTILTSIFFVFNAAGQVPLFLALLSPFEQRRQLQIILREFALALGILLLFTFCGDAILRTLGLSRPIIGVAGGILLFMISLKMIFPKPAPAIAEAPSTREPFLIPLAIPLITGPGAIAAVMMYSHETGNCSLVAAAAFCAWVPSLGIILAGSFLKKILGEKGLTAIERLGGMLICLIGTQMFASGVLTLVAEYFPVHP